MLLICCIASQLVWTSRNILWTGMNRTVAFFCVYLRFCLWEKFAVFCGGGFFLHLNATLVFSTQKFHQIDIFFRRFGAVSEAENCLFYANENIVRVRFPACPGVNRRTKLVEPVRIVVCTNWQFVSVTPPPSSSLCFFFICSLPSFLSLCIYA